MRFLFNAWYAAGLSDDIGHAPLRRVMLEQDLVVFRSENGTVLALGNRCPHRFAPLHMGKVIGDAVRCPYHGLQFGEGGVCVHNPIGEGKIPKAAKVPAYPVAELDGIVWVWFGEQPADKSKIRRFPDFSDPAFETVHGTLHVKGNYQLVADNLLDLSHAEFLHPALATEGFNRRAQYSMEQQGDTVVVKNWRPNEPITKLFMMAYGNEAPASVDHRSLVYWQAPSTLLVEVGVTRVGRPNSEGPTTRAAHLITPETKGTCHYFWRLARDFRRGDTAFSEALRATVQEAFETQDEPMIEAQHACMGSEDFDTLNPVLLPTDSASVRSRRILQQLLKAQETSQPAIDAAR